MTTHDEQVCVDAFADVGSIAGIGYRTGLRLMTFSERLCSFRLCLRNSNPSLTLSAGEATPDIGSPAAWRAWSRSQTSRGSNSPRSGVAPKSYAFSHTVAVMECS